MPNLVVEWLALLLRIREIPVSKPGLETGYTDWDIPWLPSVHTGE
jgi:hypothetical protein